MAASAIAAAGRERVPQATHLCAKRPPTCRRFGILIWGTVLAFDGDRWTKIVHGGVADPAAICDPHLYTPAAITAICLWVVAPVLGVLFTCGLFCFSCVALSTTKKTGAAKRIGGGLGSNASGSEDTGDESIWVDRAARRWRIGKPIVTLVRKCLRRSLPVEVQRQEDARQKRQEEREEEGEATPFTADGTPSPAAFVPDARFFFGGGGAAKRKQ